MARVRLTPRSYDEDVARALNPEVRGSELVALAAHRDTSVRAAVASRSDAPMATLICLAHESDRRILEALVGNPGSPPWVLRQLAVDRRAEISERALARLRLVDDPARAV